MLSASGHWDQLLFFAIVVFVPFFQSSKCLPQLNRTHPPADRAFMFGIGAVVAFLSVIVARGVLFHSLKSWPWVLNCFAAVATSALLLILRRLVFGEKKMFPVMMAILPTSIIALTVLYDGGLVISEIFPIQFSRFGLDAEIVIVCLYAHTICASWWLSDRSALCAS